jgi:hypothetical protein
MHLHVMVTQQVARDGQFVGNQWVQNVASTQHVCAGMVQATQDKQETPRQQVTRGSTEASGIQH